jgi:anti-sigma B factor antagonist
MTTTQAVVQFHQHDKTLTFRLSGRVTMPHSVPFRALAERALNEGVNRILVDLRDCPYLDSTFLGTLISLSRQMTRRNQGQLRLVSPSPGCRQLFHQMGLNDIFPTETAELDASLPWQDLPLGQPDVGTLKRNIAEAHSELAGLPGKAGEQFRVVAECLARAAEKDGHPSGSKPSE